MFSSIGITKGADKSMASNAGSGGGGNGIGAGSGSISAGIEGAQTSSSPTPVTSILAAATRGDLATVTKFLDRAVNVNTRNEKGETALYLASANGHLNVVNKLVEAHADMTLTNTEANRARGGQTPLFVAARHGHTEVVKALVEAGAEVDALKVGGRVTALFIASQQGHEKIVRLLLNHKANANIKSNTSTTPLCIAAWHGRTEAVRTLLQHGADPTITRMDTISPLYLSTSKGHLETVKVLLENPATQATINLINSENFQPIDIACSCGYTEIAEVLLEAKATVNRKLNGGVNSAGVAASTGCLPLIKLLLRYKAKLFDNNFVNPLLVACSHGRLEVAEFLVKQKADVNQMSSEPHEKSPLSLSVTFGYLDVAQMLVKAKASVNQVHDVNALNRRALVKCSGRYTALEIASGGASERFHEFVQFLLEQKADITAGENGPLNIACEAGDEAIVKVRCYDVNGAMWHSRPH